MEGEKYYYSISEAAKHSGVKPSTIRYWEQTFKTLNPRRAKNGRRVYTRKDIDTIISIKKLLYEENYKIKGAKDNPAITGQVAMKTRNIINIEKDTLKVLESQIKELFKILSS